MLEVFLFLNHLSEIRDIRLEASMTNRLEIL